MVLELESFILTKLTKPSVPVNLVGPQVSLPLYWVPANRGSIHFFVRNKEALPCVRRYSWWVRAVSGGNVFFAKYRGSFGGSLMSGGGIIILRVIRRHFLAYKDITGGSELSEPTAGRREQAVTPALV